VTPRAPKRERVLVLAPVAFNLADIFERAVDLMPERVALVCGDRRLTFAELEERSNRLAHHLAGLGLGHGDHLGIYAPNCTEWVEGMLACFKIRAVPININFRYVEDELRYIFDNADLVGVLYDTQYADRLDAVAGDLPRLRHRIAIGDEYDAALAASSPARDFGARSGDDLYILYTGGTTGMPKGVMWRQEDVFFALGQGIDATTGHKVDSDDELAKKGASGFPLVLLITPPLMHGAAQWGTFGQMAQGNTVVLMPRFDAKEVWRTVEELGVNSVLIAGDAMGRPMIEALEAAGPDRWNLSSLLAVTSSAALFSVPVKERFFTAFPNLVIVDSIGSSEGGFNGLSSVGKDNPTGGSTGGLPRVAPMADVIVVDDELNPLTPGDGNVGKVARGGNIPLGYYKDPEKTARTFLTAPDGTRYVVAGDFARLEEDGSITLLGRGSVCINSGGEKVFPEEVESVLKAHPAVFDVLVVGVPDERWGSAVAAVVQPTPGSSPTLEDLSTHARSKLAGYKLPRHLVLVEEIVRSPAGKPDYPWATALATSESGAATSQQ
jgi:3-oxocholest-4-en-26-oate---CoA ligase